MCVCVGIGERKLCTAANLSTGTKHMFGLQVWLELGSFLAHVVLERELISMRMHPFYACIDAYA